MKITFLLLTAEANGGTRVVATYAQKLSALGHEVTVIARRRPLSSWRHRLKGMVTGQKIATHDPTQTAYLHDLDVHYIELPWEVPVSAEQIPNGDVIIATWWRTAFEVSQLPTEKGAKVYFVQGHEIFHESTQDLAHGSYHLPLDKITVSHWLTRKMESQYKDMDVTTVPNGVDTTQFTAPVRLQNTRRRVGLIYSPLSLKGVDISLKAFEVCRQKFPDLELVAFGSKDPVPELPLPTGTIFHKLPEQSLIPELYAGCDAWLFGSRFEGFGLPILEAMACRTPVVATAAGAAPDLIVDGENGYVVEVEDIRAMASRLSDLLSLSAPDWQKMSEAAYNRAQQYSWDTATTSFEAALRRSVQNVSH